MRRFLILLIFCLGGWDHVAWGHETKLKSLKKRIMKECAQELNVDDQKYIDIGDYKENIDEESTCVWACAIRKYIGHTFPITTPDNKAALHIGISKMIDYVYRGRFGQIYTEHHREDIVDKVEKCYASSQNECNYFKCIELHALPLAAVNFYFDLYISFRSGSHQDNHII